MDLFEFQKALFARLGATGLTILDYVPINEPFPYVVIGEIVVTPLRTKTTDGLTITQKIDCYTESRGKPRLFEMMNLIAGALEAPMNVNGYYNITQQVEQFKALELEDKLYFGEIAFEVKLGVEEDG